MTAEEMNALLTESLPLVNYVLKRWFSGYSPQMREELFSDGLLGLWAAARSYSTCRASWNTWAIRKIRWYILEGLRNRHKYRRRHRPRFQQLNHCLHPKYRDLPDPRTESPARSALRADLQSWVVRRAGPDGPILESVLAGGRMCEAVPTLGVTEGRISQRVKALRERFDQDFAPELLP